jgi:TetR/AcrR family transcriptional repressor of nem operon
VARPRQFDEKKVLEAAMHCFWAKGYEMTSTRDLAVRMGLTSASLYNAFGDKRSLYRQALEYYLEHSVHERIRRLENGLEPLSAIRAFFDEIIERSLKDRQRRGCMLVNAALDVAPHDVELRKMVSQELARIELFFERCAAEGQMDGSITSDQSAAHIATMLLSVLLGIRVLARTGPRRFVLNAAANAAIASISVAA